MKITVDTNVLVRGVVQDSIAQTQIADQLLKEASTVAVTLESLCELAWVLHRVYGFSSKDISQAIKRLLNADNVSADHGAAEAGLASLDSGADFADGVIAYEGGWLGGETFVSFDRKAVSVLDAQGVATRLLR